MSLILKEGILKKGTKPKNLKVDTLPDYPFVLLGNYTISLQDFLRATHYVLTSTDLLIDGPDPRLQFVECVKAMEPVRNMKEDRERLYSPFAPVPTP